jgi:hypothetical protein
MWSPLGLHFLRLLDGIGRVPVGGSRPGWEAWLGAAGWWMEPRTRREGGREPGPRRVGLGVREDMDCMVLGFYAEVDLNRDVV